MFYPEESFDLWAVIAGRAPKTGGYKALDDVSLDVCEGRFVGLLGLNGAGKSTLLRVLAGIYEPTQGHSRIDGEVSGIYELGISGNEHLKGIEFADRWLRIQGVSGGRKDKLLGEIQEFSELGEYFHQPMRTYSAGMKVRLYFAVATALPERVFLIDEALTVGDEHFVAKCWRRMRRLVTNGGSGLFATHDWSAVVRLCRYAYVLDKGKVVDSGEPQGVVHRYLGLKAPPASRAKILLEKETCFEACSGKDAEIEIPVEIMEDVPVFVSIAVETFHPGFGWQNMLMSKGRKISEQAGRYRARMVVPGLPLAAGEYVLNVFLMGLPEGGEIYDSRSWTYDNGLKLSVRGRSRKSVAFLPLKRREHVL